MSCIFVFSFQDQNKEWCLNTLDIFSSFLKKRLEKLYLHQAAL